MAELRKRVAFLRAKDAKDAREAKGAKELKDTDPASRQRGAGRTATAVLERPGAADEPEPTDPDLLDPQPPRVPGSPMVRNDPRSRRGRSAPRGQQRGRRK
jgi:hypothetical protein